jgi:hypothetical protein
VLKGAVEPIHCTRQVEPAVPSGFWFEFAAANAVIRPERAWGTSFHPGFCAGKNLRKE